MSDPFIAEIKIFAGNFAPRNFAFCDGALLPIAQNTALFALVGTIYGGDGRTTLGLPNLKARAPMHAGNGPGLTPRQLGQPVGAPDASLTTSQLPSHRHDARASEDTGTSGNPAGNYIARGGGRGANIYHDDSPSANTAELKPLQALGGNQSHNNRQPYLGLNFIIALQGLFPSRP